MLGGVIGDCAGRVKSVDLLNNRVGVLSRKGMDHTEGVWGHWPADPVSSGTHQALLGRDL